MINFRIFLTHPTNQNKFDNLLFLLKFTISLIQTFRFRRRSVQVVGKLKIFPHVPLMAGLLNTIPNGDIYSAIQLNTFTRQNMLPEIIY